MSLPNFNIPFAIPPQTGGSENLQSAIIGKLKTDSNLTTLIGAPDSNTYNTDGASITISSGAGDFDDSSGGAIILKVGTGEGTGFGGPIIIASDLVSSVFTNSVTTWINRATVGNEWRGITWSSVLGIFVSVSSTGTLNRAMTSSDGITWQTQVTPPSAGTTWGSVGWSSGLGIFCAVSYTQTGSDAMISSDGITWQAHTTPGTQGWVDIIWSADLGIFCAVSPNDEVMISYNGIDWELYTSISSTWTSISWSPELRILAAVSSSGAVMTSPDGQNWTAQTPAATRLWQSIAWAPEISLFVAVANDPSVTSLVMTSPDGTAWTLQNVPQTGLDMRDVIWCDQLSHFVVATYTLITSSPDGITWTTVLPDVADARLTNIAWSPQLGIFASTSIIGTNRVITNVPDISDFNNSIVIGTQTTSNTVLLGDTIDIGKAAADVTIGKHADIVSIFNPTIRGNLLFEDYSKNTLSINAPTALVTYTLTLPAGQAAIENSVLTSTTVGITSWTAPSTSMLNLADQHIYVGNSISEPEDGGAEFTFDKTPTSPIITFGGTATGTSTFNIGSAANTSVIASAGAMTQTAEEASAVSLYDTTTEGNMTMGTGLTSGTFTLGKTGAGGTTGTTTIDGLSNQIDVGVETTGAINIGSVASGAVSVNSSSTILLGSSSSGTLTIDSGSTINVGTNSTGSTLTSASGGTTVSSTGADITLSTTTSGNLVINAANQSMLTATPSLLEIQTQEVSLAGHIADAQWSSFAAPTINSASGVTSTASTVYIEGNPTISGGGGLPTNATFSLLADNDGVIGLESGGFHVGIRANSSATENYTIQLPPAAPAGPDYILTSPASGVTSWTIPSELMVALDDQHLYVGNGVLAEDGGAELLFDNTQVAPVLTLGGSATGLTSFNIGNTGQASVITSAGSMTIESTDGALDITAGDSTALGGPINITSGDGGATNATGGTITIKGGIGQGTGTGGEVLVANDLISTVGPAQVTTAWTEQGPITGDYAYSLQWMGEPLNKFVAGLREAGAGLGLAYSSSDGISWTSVDIGLSQAIQGLGWSPELNRMVATGQSQTSRYSSDGVTWNSGDMGSSTNWASMIWASELGIFLGMSNTSNQTATSNDGITFSSLSNLPAGGSFEAVVWSPELGIFCAVSDTVFDTDKYSITSPDGITWTNASVPGIAGVWESVEWSPELGLFVAVALNQVMYSSDGDSWTAGNIFTGGDLSWVEWSPQLSLFVSGGKDADDLKYSTNGIDFLNITDPIDIGWDKVAWSPKLGIFAGASTKTTVAQKFVISTPDLSAYSSVVTLGTQAASDTKILGRNVEVGTSATDVTIGKYSSTVTIGNSATTTVEGTLKTVGGTFLNNRSLTDVQNDSTTWEFSDSVPNTDAMFTVTWSPKLGMFAAPGYNTGLVMISTDGEIWTTKTSPSADWRDIIWAEELGIFVAVSSDSVIITSSDGENWDSRTNPSGSLYGAAWSPELGLLAAVGQTGSLITSTDGITWTVGITTEPTTNWRGIAWSPELGIFVSVSANGTNQVMTSSNGINWETADAASAIAWRKITWSPQLGLFAVTSDGGGGIMTSPDGTNWTQTVISTGSYREITWSPQLGLFATANTGNAADTITTSPDGINWTTRTIPQKRWSGITWSAELGIFVSVGAAGGGIAKNVPDLSAYNPYATLGTQASTETKILGKNVEVGTSATDVSIGRYASTVTIGNNATTTVEGTLKTVGGTFLNNRSISDVGPSYINEWEYQTTPISYSIWSLVWVDEPHNRFVAGGTGAGSDGGLIVSSDGITWTTVAIADNIRPIELIWSPELDLLVSVQSGATTVGHSSDGGSSWAVSSGQPSGSWRKGTWSPELGLFCVVGITGGTNNCITSQDGITWTAQANIGSYDWRGITWSPDLGIFCAVAHNNRIATSSDGITWNNTITVPNTNSWDSIDWSPELGLLVSTAIVVGASPSGSIYSSNGSDWFEGVTPTSGGTQNWCTCKWIPQLSLFLATSQGSNTEGAMYSLDGINWSFSSDSIGDKSWWRLAWSPLLGKACSSHLTAGTALDRIMTSVPNLSAYNPYSTLGTQAASDTKILGRNVEVGTSATDVAIGKYASTVTIGDSATTTVEGTLKTVGGTFLNNRSISDVGPSYINEWEFQTMSTFASSVNALIWVGEPYNNFVAGGDATNEIITSQDGITWTLRTMPSNMIPTALGWAPELNIVVALNSISTIKGHSSDGGATWIATGTELGNWENITWSPELGLFCAVASAGTNRCMTSSDGITWTAQPGIATIEWRDVTWSPELGLFCAVGIYDGVNAFISTSSNGSTWTPRSSPGAGSFGWNAVDWSPELGLFAATTAVTSGTTGAMYSSDGSDWTVGVTPNNSVWNTCIWVPQLSLFLATGTAGYTTGAVMYSSNGINWSLITDDPSINSIDWAKLAWSPLLGKACAVNSTAGTAANRVMTNVPDLSAYNPYATLGTQASTETKILGRNVEVGRYSESVTIRDTSIRLGENGSIGLFGSNPIGQITVSNASGVTFTQGVGTAVNDNSTFEGYTLENVVRALIQIGLLK